LIADQPAALMVFQDGQPGRSALARKPLQFPFSGKGNVAAMTRETLRRTEPDAGRQVHLG